MLYNQDWTEACCKSPCHTGAGAAFVAKASALQINLANQWCFVDTVGIGDPEMSKQQLIGSIRNLIRNTAQGVHCIVMVMKMERVPVASRANLVLLKHLFKAEDLKMQGVLVLTHWEGDIGDEQEDLEEWIRSDDTIQDVVASFAKVVLTNNQLSRRGAYPECRKRCLNELTEFIVSQKYRVNAMPTGWEVTVDMFREFGQQALQLRPQLPQGMPGRHDHEVPHVLGRLLAWVLDVLRFFGVHNASCTTATDSHGRVETTELQS